MFFFVWGKGAWGPVGCRASSDLSSSLSIVERRPDPPTYSERRASGNKQRATRSSKHQPAGRRSPIAYRLAACFFLLYGTCLQSNLGICTCKVWYGKYGKQVSTTGSYTLAPRRAHIAYCLLCLLLAGCFFTGPACNQIPEFAPVRYGTVSMVSE